MVESKETILLICSGNTCRSPMAKVILEHKLKDLAKLGQFSLQSAARYAPNNPEASFYARETIKTLYGRDELCNARVMHYVARARNSPLSSILSK